jgi:hypothetical protein
MTAAALARAFPRPVRTTFASWQVRVPMSANCVIIFDEADDVLSVGVVVRVVAVDARDLLPGEIFDGGEWGFTADLEDRFEDGSGASVEEFDVALSPPSLEAVEDAVLEQRGGGLEPCRKGVTLQVARATSRHDLRPARCQELSGDRPAIDVSDVGQVVHRADRARHVIARASSLATATASGAFRLPACVTGRPSPTNATSFPSRTIAGTASASSVSACAAARSSSDSISSASGVSSTR